MRGSKLLKTSVYIQKETTHTHPKTGQMGGDSSQAKSTGVLLGGGGGGAQGGVTAGYEELSCRQVIRATKKVLSDCWWKKIKVQISG